MNLREHLPLVKAPESVWNAIETAMQEDRQRARRPVFRWPMVFAAAAAIFCLAAGIYWFGSRQTGWIETSASARATLRIGDRGSVEMGPYTRLRVVADREDQHRLMLARGTIFAKITAPPRLFFVDTNRGRQSTSAANMR